MSDYHEHVYLPCNQLKQMYHDQSFYLPSMVSHNTYYHSSHMASFNQLSINAPTHTSSQTTSFFGQSKYSPTDSGIGGSPSFLQASPDHFTGSSLSHPTPTANFNFFQNGSVELSTSSADVSTQMRHKKGPTEKKKCSREGKTRNENYRTVYSATQRAKLEEEYQLKTYIHISRKEKLSEELNLSQRQVKIWFQNRRAKERRALARKETVTGNEEKSHNQVNKSNYMMVCNSEHDNEETTKILIHSTPFSKTICKTEEIPDDKISRDELPFNNYYRFGTFPNISPTSHAHFC